MSIGPAAQKIVGSPMLIAPITVPGVVLSQPASSTTPSIGSERSVSSTSIARKLRYSMVVGLTITSPRLIAGSSNGMPPAIRMPRLTASARSRRCAWQGDRSLQVLMTAMHGRSSTSSRRRPICCTRCRCANARMSLAANQRRLRRSASVFFWAIEFAGEGFRGSRSLVLPLTLRPVPLWHHPRKPECVPRTRRRPTCHHASPGVATAAPRWPTWRRQRA